MILNKQWTVNGELRNYLILWRKIYLQTCNIGFLKKHHRNFIAQLKIFNYSFSFNSYDIENALTVNGDLALVETAFTGAGAVFISRAVVD